MVIPAASKDNCPHCAERTHAYDPECRACFIRSIAHMPIKHRGERYLRITQQHGHQVMTTISDEVAAWYKQHKSWGTFS